MYRCKDCKSMLTEEEIVETESKDKICPYCGGSEFVMLDTDVELLEER